jgi:glycosyltransferase involved in cell wall biosynthesis
VTVISYRRTYPSFSKAGRQGPDPSPKQIDVPYESMLVPWRPWTWVAASRRIRDFRPDTLVIQWWHPITAGCIWYVIRRARALGIDVIVVCHNAFPHEGFPLGRTLTLHALKGATSLMALSDTVATEVQGLLPNFEVSVIPLPPLLSTDLETLGREVAAWRERIDAPAECKTVLFFGNVRPYKGLMTLVESFASVVQQVRAVLIIAGTFFEREEPYRQRVADLGLEDSVRVFPEYVRDEAVAGLFVLSDLVVLPYRSASQSGAIPLAAAFERPVVASAVGGIPAALGGTGRLVPPNDSGALADAIVEALHDPPAPPPADAGGWESWRQAVLST